MPGGQNQKTILILEDGLLLAMEIEEAVRGAGYDVTVAGSLHEARAAIETTRFDGAVLDYVLPDGRSDDLALHLASRCPVAFMSGYGREELNDTLQEFPLFDKPVDMDALLLWFARSLDREPG